MTFGMLFSMLNTPHVILRMTMAWLIYDPELDSFFIYYLLRKSFGLWDIRMNSLKQMAYHDYWGRRLFLIHLSQ